MALSLVGEKSWSRREESNTLSTDYKSVALPLSYTGADRKADTEPHQFYIVCPVFADAADGGSDLSSLRPRASRVLSTFALTLDSV
jgi:hypothetical protein